LDSAHSQLAKCLHCLYQLRESLRFSKVGRDAPTQCILCPKVGEPYSPGFLPYNGQELFCSKTKPRLYSNVLLSVGLSICILKGEVLLLNRCSILLFLYTGILYLSPYITKAFCFLSSFILKAFCIFLLTYPRHSVICSLHTQGILYLSPYIFKAFCILLLTYPRHSVSFFIHAQCTLYLSLYIPKAFCIFLLT